MIRDSLISIDLPEWARWYQIRDDGSIDIFEHRPLFATLDGLTPHSGRHERLYMQQREVEK